MSTTGRYRILSLDGGGIRGIYTLTLLRRLDERVGGFLDKADLLAGTSTGGIIALGLAAGRPLDELRSFYEEHGQEVFSDSWADNIVDVGKIIGADYSNRNLKRILTDTFGSLKLKDLERKVLIPTFDLDPGQQGGRTWKPKFFHNFTGRGSDGQEYVVDVAMRTSAAPTYFPSYQGYIDGGVVANNPGMAALAQALDKATGGQKLEGVRLLSLGTGLVPQYIAGDRHDWGYAQWAKPIISVMMDGMMGVADYQCRKLLGRRYHRLAPVLPEPIALDAAAKVADLVRLAEAVKIADAARWIRREFG
ncbi:MAG: hypothetical protein BWK77_08245 [Verrucomicrobia bacterium A1]|nr:MAG: hypothetical protein BWK77_08245 [Verrucomicrobia bacterium A1]